jgi:S-DNA-T family DNA segregation ATPase FtsK/SpoIIIE
MLKDVTEKQYVESFTDGVDFNKLSDEEKIKAKLLEFGLPVDMDKTYYGPHITKFTLKPSRGVRMSQFEKHEKDLAIALQAVSIRVEAPIMGTSLVGVEIPARERKFFEWTPTNEHVGTLKIPVGSDVYGNVVYKDLSAMPHLLVAGTTGSGKSVLLNVIIKALTEQNPPEALRLVLIDPKQVELTVYEGLPHLEMAPITEVKEAARVL